MGVRARIDLGAGGEGLRASERLTDGIVFGTAEGVP
jgi:hypothetical protein